MSTNTTIREAEEIIREQVDTDAACIPAGAILAWLQDNHYDPEQASEHLDAISDGYRGEWQSVEDWAWAELDEMGLQDLPEWVDRDAVVKAWLASMTHGGWVTTYTAANSNVYVFTY